LNQFRAIQTLARNNKSMVVKGLGSMNEERFEAYLGLIQKLLNCHKGQELALLQRHQSLVDHQFVQVMEQIAAQMAAEGKADTATFLQSWAEELRNALAEPATDRPTSEQGDRDEAYMNLIKELLSCRKGAESEILKANEHLVDRGLVQQMQRVAAMLSEKGDESDANFLLGLAQQLSEALSFVPNTQLVFLQRVLHLIQESSGNAEVVLPLLQEHANQLDETFPHLLQTWAEQTFAIADPKEALKLAADLVIFGDLIQLLPQGNPSVYEEIALTSYRLALPLFPLEKFPNQWAIIHKRMGETYSQHRGSNQAANIETAIQCFQNALKVYTPSDFPEEWARVQKDLGEAYHSRIKGDRTENLEQAVKAYADALKVYTGQA
jgi:tetratricopeptide (TPR) repeat protein